MTEPLVPSIESDQLRRIEELRSRRAGASTTPPRRRTAPGRPHAASGSRVAAAGGGLAAMLGLVAVFGLIERSVAAEPVQRTGTVPSQFVVVIHRGDSARPADRAGSATVTPAPGPIALTARPTVTGSSPVSPTPAATTNGSR